MKKKPKIVASIEARMTSSRLPGKVLLPAIRGMSMIELMIDRVKQSKYIDEIVVATTTNDTDNPIIELCIKKGVKFYRGSEDDVLGRVLQAHKSLQSDIIVELTGDCPLVDPEIIDGIINEYLENNFDYVSNSHVRSLLDVSEPCFYNQDWYLKEKFIDKQLESNWYLIRKYVFQETRAKNPEDINNCFTFTAAIL